MPAGSALYSVRPWLSPRPCVSHAHQRLPVAAGLRAGKSTLLVALLHFLLRQRACGGSPLAGCRMLVAASTNVAVDRVLLGLQESGCTTFLRVGPIRRIAPQLLPQSLHCSEGKAGVVAELKQMLAEAGGAGDGHEAAVIQQELALAERGGAEAEVPARGAPAWLGGHQLLHALRGTDAPRWHTHFQQPVI